MEITNLKLTNFRNYQKLELEFSKNKNIIIGNNGMGKTNIIEAIYFLALTKSFRCNEDKQLIQEESETSTIEATIFDKINNNYKIVINKGNKLIKIDNNPINKISDYISKINIILFSIEDLKLIKESPNIHRKIINMELSILNNEYLKLLSYYNKILKQRNMYLKNLMINSLIPRDYLDVITEKMIETGIKINQIRKDYIDEINKHLSKIFFKTTKKNNLIIKYRSSFSNKSKERLIKDYKTHLQQDINYGKTGIGIHLDDYIFEINKKEAKYFLSEGEQKSAVIAYKLSEIKYCDEVLKKKPILILDDLFSELDKQKINRLLNNFNKKYQTFITTTDIEKINKKVLINCKVIKIKNKGIEVKTYE